MSLCPYQTITCKTVIVWEHNRENRYNRLNGLGNSEKNGERVKQKENGQRTRWREREREVLRKGDEES